MFATTSGGLTIALCPGPDPACHETCDECDDGMDNDDDGLVDCNDTEFMPCPACHETSEVCNNGVDDDGDGKVDCDDPDCRVDKDRDGCLAPPCGNDCDDNNPLKCPSLPELCMDGLDNDCDGFADCNDVDCRNDLDNDNCLAPPCGPDCNDADPSTCICLDKLVPHEVPSYINFGNNGRGVITLPIPGPVRFRDELNLDFCEALKEGIEEIVLELDDCDPITIPGALLKSNRSKTMFRVKSASGETPGYSLNIDCKKGLLKLQIWNVNLTDCVFNPVRTCVTIKDGPSLCAEDEFKEVRDRKGRLKKLIYTGK